MKRFILLLFAVLAFISCENIEDNTPAMQGDIDNLFFKTEGVRAYRDEVGGFLIQGQSKDETLTLKINGPQPGAYPVGGQSLNYAYFSDASGRVYATNPFGMGQIALSNYDADLKTLSGSFNFNLVLPDLDTLTMSRGIFFEVPVGLEPIVDPADGQIGNAGSFFAEVNGIPFEPIDVGAIELPDRIRILGRTLPVRIEIKVPDGVTTGSYNLLAGGFGALYADGFINETAVSGEIVILEHDFTNDILRATFNFETETVSITSGLFDISY